ncbi:hypothetical protein F4819DRAFT_498148 [Hypoxylon fuscum]|nr:hypothetical protein F4819DRAFT_498148 [Hypoxylon fuscum]
MASFGVGDRASSPVPTADFQHDPFVTAATPLSSSHHRFSNFDSQIFALGPNASPAQAKRALEAHLAETDRRMEEAGKLGTALVQQRKELSERLKEFEKLESEGGLSDDLRQRLVEIEKDYNDVARESARAFLPKQRVPSNEAAAGSPFVPEGKGGRRSVSPSKFEGQATGSPTKFSVPNRKVRNQPANRIHDIEFAAEISTSLIAQVRNLQGLLSEKEEELKEIKMEKSKLEYEAEGFQQRVKTLDESEHRYKDENWNLETQVHDLLAKEREASDREKKLQQTLNILQAEKNSTQRELDEVKLNYSKLSEEHATVVKHHDIELGTAKRNIVIADSERLALRRKIDDLTGQNTELAKAVSASQRARVIERESILGMSDEDFETAHDKTTPEHSPPPSPVKGTPRHSMLESETLKTSLGHAQRTIQGLRNNVHREKTEKLELKRMLQEARDELEKVRHDPMAQNKRSRKADQKELKKPLRLLGNLRTVRSEIFSEDSNWEDQPESIRDSSSPARSSLASRGSSKFESVAEEPFEQFETANETSDAAFETANEPATETDDFHTGAEEFSSDDDAEETETDSPSKRRTPRNRPGLPYGLQRSGSMHSTASTEDEDYPFDHQLSTPTMLPPPQKFQVRVSRGALRRPRQLSEEPIFHSSPPSIASSSVGGTPQQIQSLAAELGDFDASDNESTLSGTPSRRSIRGRTVSPPPPVPPLPRVIMVDSGTMTEELPESHEARRPMSLDTVFSCSSTDSLPHDIDDKLAKFPSPPTSPPQKESEPSSELEFSSELEGLRSSHADDVSRAVADAQSTHVEELAALKSAHAEEISKVLAEAQAAHVKELEAKSLSEARSAHTQELETLKSSHAEEINQALAETRAAHAQELEELRSNYENQAAKAAAENRTAHGQEVDALKVAFAEQASQKALENKAAHDAELEALKSSHAEQIATKESDIKATHATENDNDARYASDTAALVAAHSTHSQEIEKLESIKEAHSQHIENLKKDSNALHAAEIAALIASHGKQIESVKAESEATLSRELARLKENHAHEIDTLNSQHATTRDAAHTQQIDALNAAHAQVLEAQKRDSEKSQNVEALKSESAAARSKELDDMASNHLAELDALKQEHGSSKAQALGDLSATHSQQVEDLRQNHLAELATLGAEHDHATALETLKKEHEVAESQKLRELAETHARELESLREENEKTNEIDSLRVEHETLHHSREVESLRQAGDSTNESGAAHARELEKLKAAHAHALATLDAQHQSILDSSLESLRNDYTKVLEESKKQRDLGHAEALEALRTSHSEHVAQLQSDATATLTRELEALKADHAAVLGSYERDSAAEKEKLLANHAAELEALRKSLESTELEPIEMSESRSPRREAFIIPREERPPMTPPLSAIGPFGRKGDKFPTPEIAEDETRQSPNATPGPETPESQRPFKEIAQTTLTSEAVDRLLKHHSRISSDTVTITTARGEVTVTPFDDARMGGSDAVSAPEAIPVRRPGSSASAQGSALNRPPLPANHKDLIDAARTGSSGGGKGTMGPPLLPASAYKLPPSRPETPSSKRPMSPVSVRGTPTPRAGRGSMPGYADIHSVSRMPLHSRKSSVSSFASEIDTRFNTRGEMGMDAAAFGPGTDPRMIQAITQTMIGEYLWKYTRKTGRGEMSENRHRRYFWVHPYTKTLYWSDRDPATSGGRSELKAKSIPIEAVRVVGDENPMPPGLHQKSLIIISPGRTVKFTCTTGQRHETWFNALSYLLLRTGDETQTDAEEMAGQITQEDVDEFNPSMTRRPVNGNRARPPPSLSSYNSGTTRHSPNVEVSLSIPTLTPTREREANRSTGTLGRLSGYWKSSGINSTFSSLRSRSHLPTDSAIYEASEVPDSAEDLRHIIEQQDRESDRLENVRACCDGKHDVGTIPHKRGRIPNMHSHSHSHTHPTHPGPSTTPTPGSTKRARV